MIEAVIAGAGLVGGLTGPIISQSFGEFRFAINWNDVARARTLLYAQQRQSASAGNIANYEAIRLDFEQAVRVFNQANWAGPDPGGLIAHSIWLRLRSDLRDSGILTEVPGQNDNDFQGDDQTANLANEWMRLIEMSSQAAPLNQVVVDYHRSKVLPANEQTVSLGDLSYHLARAQVRREDDKGLITYPFYKWSIPDIFRLQWIRNLTDAQTRAMLSAAGVTRPADHQYADDLARQVPAPDVLLKLELAGSWRDDITKVLNLDAGLDASPIPKFFSMAQGVGAFAMPFPLEPAGESDWRKLTWRASRKLPDFAGACKLMHQLRDNGAGLNESIVPGIPVWTPEMSQAILERSGMPGSIAKQMVAAADEPFPLHMLATLLTPMLEKPAIRDLAAHLFKNNANWLKDALLDHGFNDNHAQLLEAVIRQEASDKHLAEQIGVRTQLKHERRALILQQYAQGVLSVGQVQVEIIEEQFTPAMCSRAIEIEDRKVNLQEIAVGLQATKEAYLSGQVNDQQLRTALDGIGITPQRRDVYMMTWHWERGTNQKHLSTGEILDAMKAGLLTPAQVQYRLVNLGWRYPDALIEVATVQHSMMVSQAHQVAAQQAHVAAQLHQAAAAAQHAAHTAQAATHAAIAASQHLTREQVLAVHKRLMDQSKYYATVFGANKAYEAAAAKSDQHTMDEELAKEVAAYQKYLVQQMTLVTANPGVLDALGQIDFRQAAGPDTSPKAADTAPGAGQPPGPDTSASGGDAAPAAP